MAGRGALIFGGLAIHTSLGAFFAWSVFLEPLRRLHGWDEATLFTPYRYALVWFTIGLFAASQLSRRQSPRALARLGSILLVSGCLCAVAAGSSLAGLTLGIGVLGGLGAGFAYLAPISTFRHWLPSGGGFFIGLSAACFAAGSLLSAPPLLWMLTRQDTASAVSAAFLAMALLFVVGVAIMGELLPDTRAWLAPRVFEALRGDTLAPHTARQRAWDESVMPLLRLWLLWSVFFIGCFAGVAALVDYLPILQAFEWRQAWLAMGACVAILAMTNRWGHAVWESIVHRRGRTFAFLTLLTLATGLSLIVTGGHVALSPIMAMLALLGFGGGGFLGLMPQLSAEMLDSQESLPLRFGVMFSAFGLCASTTPFWLNPRHTETLAGSISILALNTALLLGFLYLLARPARTGSCVSQALSRW